MSDEGFSFRCSTCDEVHVGTPSFSYDAPIYWESVPEAERGTISHLTTDTCVIEGQHYFVCACLEIPIHGYAEPFVWGVWSSLSAESFGRLAALREAPVDGESFFGWFCNQLPFYPDTLNLKVRVHPRSDGLRPFLELEPTDHPLAVDYREGVTIDRARQIMEAALHACVPDADQSD